MAVIVSGDQADALEGVTFSGTGVSPAPSFAHSRRVGRRWAWWPRPPSWTATAGTRVQRTVKFKSTKPLTVITVMAAEGAIDPGHRRLHAAYQSDRPPSRSTSRSRSSRSSPLRRSRVKSQRTTWPVPLRSSVVPTDEFGNPSLRIDNNTGSKDYTSVAFTFASSNAAVSVPSGQQMVTSTDGSTYGAVAATPAAARRSASGRVETYTTGAAQGCRRQIRRRHRGQRDSQHRIH